MFAGAAFTDQADIKVDSEVVDTLVSLGVINGYTDGSFKPNDTVTRAEMAKMIYVLRTGNSDASAYNDDKTCLLYTSPSPRDVEESRMPSSA